MIDTHAHLFDSKIINSVDEIIKKSKDINIKAIIVPTVTFETFEITLKLVEKYPAYLFPAFGIHPTELVFDRKFCESFEANKFTGLIVNHTKRYRKEIIAIGETGLDYFWLKKEASYNADKKVKAQNKIKKLFEIQIKVAEEFNLPVIVHLRDIDGSTEVYEDAFEIISKYPECKYHFHSFSGDRIYLNKILDLRNSVISYTANFAYNGNSSIKENLLATPLSKLVIETDSPYLPPMPKKKYPNTPVQVIEIAKQISELKNINLSDLENQTDETAINFYQLKL